jgi:hypothetical protein
LDFAGSSPVPSAGLLAYLNPQGRHRATFFEIRHQTRKQPKWCDSLRVRKWRHQRNNPPPNRGPFCDADRGALASCRFLRRARAGQFRQVGSWASWLLMNNGDGRGREKRPGLQPSFFFPTHTGFHSPMQTETKQGARFQCRGWRPFFFVGGDALLCCGNAVSGRALGGGKDSSKRSRLWMCAGPQGTLRCDI